MADRIYNVTFVTNEGDEDVRPICAANIAELEYILTHCETQAYVSIEEAVMAG